MANKGTPWRDWLRGAARLGVMPEAFWRLSLAEWRALTARERGLSRPDFEALTRRFPDEKYDR